MNNETDNRIENNGYEQSEMIDEYLYSEQAQENEGTNELVPSETKPVPKKKKRKKKRYFLKFCIFVLLCVAVYFILHSSLFTVKKIVLEENTHMTVEQVKEVTGYKKGINLFEIGAGKNEKKLEKDTYVKEAEISRELPDTVKISLTLRKPVAVIKSDKGYVLIDDDDIVIDVLEQPPQYTVISGITVKEAKKGQPVGVKEKDLYDEYMELLDKIEKADMYFKAVSIDGRTVTAYATDSLCCTGKTSNVIEGMENGNLQAIFYDLMEKGIKAGTVKVGDDQYYSFAR